MNRARVLATVSAGQDPLLFAGEFAVFVRDEIIQHQAIAQAAKMEPQ